jgi:DNA primase
VSRESGLFHCFGCGVGGDVIGFVTRFHQISFREALSRLAVRAGLSIDALMENGELLDGSRRTVVGSERERISTLPSTNYRLPSVVNGRRP